MKHIAFAAAALALLCCGCTPVLGHASLRSTPETTLDCAGDLLGSMGYQLLDREGAVRAERPKHAVLGGGRGDYDRITVVVARGRMQVRGETVATNGGMFLPGYKAPAGATTITWPSKRLRAEVQLLTTECGMGSQPVD